MDRLGIIDWGIGGISIFKQVKQSLPDLPITYLSDTGAVPYGKLTRLDLTNRLDTVIGYLKGRGVTHLVIGCNAASTAVPHLKDHGIVIEGIIEPAVLMTLKLRPGRLGLIGGRRTVMSGVYRRSFSQQGIAVRQRVAQPLSGMIESGDTSSARLRAECGRILRPLRNCSHVLLACTHYPAISDVLSEYLDPVAELIDPSTSLIEIVRRWDLRSAGSDLTMTTGSPRAMRTAARSAFKVELGDIEHVAIDQ